MASPFSWTTFDVNSQLPAGWQQDIAAAARYADVRNFPRTPVLSREAENVAQIPRGRVHADQVRNFTPWLLDYYQGYFLELAGKMCAERVRPAADHRYGVVLNVQNGDEMRFECHVDSNPLTGLLFCTDHPAGSGGELVIANDMDAVGVAEVDQDCSVIRPHAGHLIFFDGSRNPHYARFLSSNLDTRVVAVMNFYTRTRPESTRPPELNRHLYGPEGAPRVKVPMGTYIQRLRQKVLVGSP